MKRNILILLTFIIAAVSGSHATASLTPASPLHTVATMNVPHEVAVFEPMVITAKVSAERHDDTAIEVIVIEEPLIIYARSNVDCELDPTNEEAPELGAEEQNCAL